MSYVCTIMRKFSLFLFAISSLVALYSCTDTKTEASVTRPLDVEMGSETFSLGDVLVSEQGRLKVSDMKFYLSDLYIHYTDGDSALWSEMVLIDLEENKTLKNVYNTILLKPIEAISAGLGVKPEWNEGVDPSEFSPEEPLSFQSSNGMHWGWETGYKFLIFDAIADTGSGAFDWPISYHVGTSEMYTRFKVRVTKANSLIVLHNNLSDLFAQTILQMDIKVNPQTHTINNKDVALKFRNAFIETLELK